MAIKWKDFIEVDYTGKQAQTGEVFDSTIPDVANSINPENNVSVSSVKLCLGQARLIKGLEDAIVGKETGDKFSVKLSAVDGFGKRNPKLIQLVPTKKFLSQGIRPAPGLQLNIDGMVGTIKAVTGGRTIVDFNHPMAGHDVEYDVEIKRMITDVKEKVEIVLETFNIPGKVQISADKAIIEFENKMPKELNDLVTKKVTEAISEIKSVEFKSPKPEEKTKN